jgi:hypothetical protein
MQLYGAWEQTTELLSYVENRRNGGAFVRNAMAGSPDKRRRGSSLHQPASPSTPSIDSESYYEYNDSESTAVPSSRARAASGPSSAAAQAPVPFPSSLAATSSGSATSSSGAAAGGQKYKVGRVDDYAALTWAGIEQVRDVTLTCSCNILLVIS